jgi:formylglycine-generating enzyme required for sulfatase activity
MKRAALLGLLAACSTEAPPRPQLVLVIDTDAPLVGQIAADPDLSSDAAVDTLRVDLLAPGDPVPYDHRDLVVPEAARWPVTLGVVAPNPPLGHPVRVRIRAFRGRSARKGTVREKTSLEPLPGVSIERVIDVDLPSEGIRMVRVHLSADCFGTPPSFVDEPRTCVDDARKLAKATEGLTDVEAIAPTRAGTWPRVRVEPCRTQPAEGRVCVPGGFLLLGDPDFAGIADEILMDSVPLRPARVSPFHMDLTEFTVGRMRALARAGFTHSLDQDRIDPHCTWRGPDDPSRDRYPLNCVSWDTARRACEAEGGTLPSEAQWEHAARGRERRLYPWGDRSAECCTLSASRSSGGGEVTECPGSGPEPVGSHRPTGSCKGGGDMSRDGVLDLGGSVSETTLDHAAELTSTCWSYRGVPLDPVCIEEARPYHTMRGAHWNSGLSLSLAALRKATSSRDVGAGFRCVYKDGP